jgi:hypothetical protein
MAHDAASAYLDTSNIITGEVYDWTKTQDAPNRDMADLLNCGTRTFDWRPSWAKGKLVGHHGDITVDHEFSASLAEIKAWCDANPSELIMMHIWDCNSDDANVDCNAKVREAMAALELPVVDNCSQLQGITVGQAKAMGKLASGGMLLPVFTNGGLCTASNYDETIACWGTRSPFAALKESQEQRRMDTSDDVLACIDAHGVDLNAPYDSLTEEERLVVTKCINEHGGDAADQDKLKALFTYSCWTDGSYKEVPIDQMTTYLDKVFAAGPSGTSNPLYQGQALWQESTASVVIGELHLSSLMEDEAKSGLNSIVAGHVREGRWANVNLVEVNNVCDGGNDLKNALDEFNSKHPASAKK